MLKLVMSPFEMLSCVSSFINNSVFSRDGGAIFMRECNININISEHAEVSFVSNTATLQDGAIDQSWGVGGSISIDRLLYME